VKSGDGFAAVFETVMYTLLVSNFHRNIGAGSLYASGRVAIRGVPVTPAELDRGAKLARAERPEPHRASLGNESEGPRQG
jgi:hypothetical protein